MAENKKSFVLYTDIIHTVKKMPREKAGDLLVLILEYVNDENPIVTDMLVELVFEPIKQQLKRDLKIWETVRQSRSEAGRKGMEKRWNSKDNTDITKITGDNSVIDDITKITVNANVNVNDIVKEKGIIGEKPKSVFCIPTLDAILTYCTERKNKVDANKFHDFYQSKGWMVGKNKMKDWKACVRTWEKSETPETSQTPKKTYNFRTGG